MNNQSKSDPEKNVLLQPDSKKSPSSFLLVVVLLIIFSMVIWQWFQTRHHLNQMEQVLSEKLEQFNEKNQQTLALAKNADDRSANTVARISLLEQQFEKTLDQQQALQTLYSEFANNREEHVVAEVEQLLIIANQQLQLAGNVKPALIALQSADARLTQLDTQQAIQLRKLITQNIQQLQNLPTIDIIGMSLKLENLTKQIDDLPLVTLHSQSSSADPIGTSPQLNQWQRLLRQIWQDIKSMVKIERVDHPQPPLLTAEQGFFLRENIKLHLLTARVALLQHDETTYRADLSATQNWLSTYFDVRNLASKNFLSSLKELSSNTFVIQMPDISDSLNLVSTYKLSLESNSVNVKNTLGKK